MKDASFYILGADDNHEFWAGSFTGLMEVFRTSTNFFLDRRVKVVMETSEHAVYSFDLPVSFTSSADNSTANTVRIRPSPKHTKKRTTICEIIRGEIVWMIE